MADCKEIEAGRQAKKKKGKWNFWRLSEYDLAGYEIFPWHWSQNKPTCNGFLLMLCTAWWTAEIGRERNWKNEEIEMLITLYEERPCLWD